MAKPKKEDKKITKPGKHDIVVKLDMTFEEAMKKAVNTPPKKKPKK